MVNTWDDMADFWDEHEDVIMYADKAFSSLSKIYNLNGKKVLDFGCGTGLLTEKIAKIAKEVYAIDSSQKMITILEEKNISNITAYTDTLSEDFLEDNSTVFHSFDLIVASSVCVFLENYTEVLVLLKSLLKPEGTFIQWDWMTEQYKIGEGFDKGSITSTFNTVGLNNVSISNPFSLDGQEVLMAVGLNSMNHKS
ncbi:class I SAM-dependent DNA methyltransferase [Poseidonibacter lekithochrous]|uniref:class I SAM-dependent DNA methyltransferase n=1 Tax=Poseidonibacter lekithochrous TaxID=1904463 RepID=UPI000D37934B|nr:class I SAM-dependent methyltransferase [Poseidonibacter lekithochrous]